jgi:hypothetical protein
LGTTTSRRLYAVSLRRSGSVLTRMPAASCCMRSMSAMWRAVQPLAAGEPLVQVEDVVVLCVDEAGARTTHVGE